MKTLEILKKYRACGPLIDWVEENGYLDFKDAWNNCPRGDWMLWIAQKLDIDIRTLTLAKALCVNTVRHLMEDQRSKDALLVAIKFGRGKASKKELADASASAYAAYLAAYTAIVAYAAYLVTVPAAYTAIVAYTAVAVVVAYADTAHTSYADYAAAEKENQLKTANICRKILTKEVFEKLNIN